MKTTLKVLLSAALLAFSATFGAYAQGSIEVKGQVTEAATGESIPAATVSIQGTLKGVITDADGNYSISVPANGSLVFSCLGFKEKVEAVGGRAVLNVALDYDSEMLEEAIAIGYGTVKRSDLTGSVASVKADQVIKSPSGSIDKMLQGRVAGLTVIDNSNDSPTGGVTMRVRGISSINGSNSPLVVIDGVPYGDAGNLIAINPNIIESIEVLKDASATAIYGSRGANGVIMITTKNGQEDHTNVWYSGKVAMGMFSTPIKVWREDRLAEMAEVVNLKYENGGATGPYMGTVFSDGVYYPSVDEIESGAWPYYTYWPGVVLRKPSVTQDHNVGIEGSSKGSHYYASLGYYAGQGMTKNDDYNKISGDISYQNEIKKRLRFSTKAGFTFGKRKSSNGASSGYNALWPVYNGDGSYFRTKSNDYSNPVMILNEITNDNQGIYGYLSGKLDWTIIDGLVLSISGNGKMNQNRAGSFNPPKYTNGGDTYNGEGSVSESTWYQVQTDAYLTYAKKIKRHNFSAMLGASWEDRVDNSSSITGRGFTNTVLKYETISSAEKIYGNTGRSEWAIASAFTRLTYDYDGRYFATFTARADGSSKFAEGHKWGFFPSGAIGWRIDNEPWMKSLGIFDLLKLRASWGISGNQGISPYRTFEQYGYDYYWDYSSNKEVRVHGVGYQSGREGIGNRYVTYAGMANHDLTWEKTRQTNVGLDIAVLNNRLEITADYYYKFTYDLLRQQYLPPSSGFDTVWTNDGEILNHGFELSITGRIVENKDWSLSATAILAHNKNKVVRLGTNANSGFTTDPNGISFTAHGGSMYDSPYLNVLAIGYPVNVFYGYEVKGIIQEEIGDGTSRYTEPGELNYIGLREDGTFNSDKRKIIGDPNPKLTGSLALNFTHRIGIDFSMLIYGVYGNDIFSTSKLGLMEYNREYWTEEKPSRFYPKPRYNRSYLASSWSVEDGSYLRISNLTLGYTLPKGNIKWLDNLRIYLSCNNPWTLNRTHEYDPEVGEKGTGSFAYPKICTITTGLELKF